MLISPLLRRPRASDVAVRATHPKKTGVVTPAFFGPSGSVYFHVAGGIEVAGPIFSGVAEVLHVDPGSGGIGRSRTLGNGSVGVAVAAELRSSNVGPD